MFTTVYNLERLILQDLKFVIEACETGVETSDYLESMEDMVDRRLKRLSEISCNKKLFNNLQKKAFDVFDKAFGR